LLFDRFRRLFVKVFLWFWLTAIALFVIFFGSRTIGTRVLAPNDVIAAFAPRVAQEAAGSYESGGAKEFAKFADSIDADHQNEIYLIDGAGNEVLSRRIPPESRSIVGAVRSDGRIITHFSLLSRSAAYRFTSPSGHPYVLLVRIRLKPGKFLEDAGGSGLLFFCGVLLLVTLLCLWLTHHITWPIRGLQAAARKLATGDLSVRSPREISRRRDELAALALDFDSMVERMAALVGAQRNLLSTVSHELRSPLARFNMTLGLLRSQSSPGAENLLDRMERDVERIDDLIGQLITLSRLETGLSSNERKDLNLSQLVQEVVADGDFEAHSSGKSVRLWDEGNIRLEKADQQALRSACENIIRNAVRFTRPGTEVQVTLRSEHEDASLQAILRVRDYGPGVPAASLQQIFQPFFRVRSERSAEDNGSGLGLAIAFEAIRLHRGSIVASNADPCGLEVKISLPASLLSGRC
jgi:two-component system, OmpR family, sensor histidine kinase CpxA